MKRLFLLGSELFAVEVLRYLGECSEGWSVQACLALPGEAPAVASLPVVPILEHRVDPAAGYVLASSDPERRRAAIRSFIEPGRVQLPNVIHPTARVDAEQLHGAGNIVGPFCYAGANARLGRLNVLNAFCSLGHHTRLGDNNFFAPDVHTGNSVTVGDNNLFGIGTHAAHGLAVGSDNRVQAGTAILETIGDGQLVLKPGSVKQVKLYGGHA
jgi:UDP-3-O-[3-hydroxymyristoyl] glucosamine N-acyltransferase